jgi:hypothetical protein
MALRAEEDVFNLVRNPSFERGSKGWSALWDERGAVIVADQGLARSGKRFLTLTADGANVGIDSDPIYAGEDFDVDEQNIVSAYISNQGVARGGFGLRLYCYGPKGKYLAMKSIGEIGPHSPQAGWQKVEARLGPGTDFAFSKDLKYVVIRFSFWSKENDCRGKVLVDDVYFGPLEDKMPVAIRKTSRPPKGAIAVWKDKVPVVGAASNPDYLASLLEKAGFGVSLITTKDMTDLSTLNAKNFDMLVLPYGEVYPSAGADVIRRFLRGGGSLVSLGGRCCREPIYDTPGGWVARASIRSNALPPRPMVKLSEEFAASLAHELAQGNEPADISLSKDSTGNPALRVVVPDLKSYKYVPFDLQGVKEYSIIHFHARGDENTQRLCIEANESDNSRWKAIVGLSTEWKAYEVSTGEFVSYATKGRGGRGDFLHSERVKRISWGFPVSLVGKGKHSFEISELEWRASDIPPQELAHGAILLTVSSDLIKAFGAQLKPPSGAGDIAAFFGSKQFQNAAELHPAPNQSFFPQSLTIKGGVSGWTTTILEDNFFFLARHKAAHPDTFLPAERLARAVPLLLTPDGQPAASLFINIGGRYADSLWACFGVTNRDIFPPGDKESAEAFVSLADRMLCGAFFTALEPRFTVRDGRAKMEVMVEIDNRADAERNLLLQSRLTPLDGKSFLVEKTSTVHLGPHEETEFLALEVPPDSFDWKHFKVECCLLSDGQVLDSIKTSVRVRETFLAICDRFVRTQKERGDGKFSGIGFVDNRGARGLLAAYDLTGKKEYLNAAIAWGDAIIAEQRPDGGYLMGYGYHPDGDECFVADGGEIACGIARLVTYAPDKKRFMASLRAYMAYRDSFRCEGGGIGVGWCRSDYGARPVKPLDKTTKIYAPEENIYTIGCTLTAATMFALLTRSEKDNDAAVKDAYWWMNRCKKTTGGAFVESAIWANKFLRGETIKKDTEEFLRQKFIPNVVGPESRWWTTGEGRTVQGLDGLAYYYDRIEKDPQVLATLMRAAYHVCSPEALSGIPRILAKPQLTQPEWLYLNFASVSMPDLLKSEIIRKNF